jgi:hypothetical protein
MAGEGAVDLVEEDRAAIGGHNRPSCPRIAPVTAALDVAEAVPIRAAFRQRAPQLTSTNGLSAAASGSGSRAPRAICQCARFSGH